MGPSAPISRGTWSWQDPLPDGTSLHAISCPSTTTCFTGGSDGQVRATTNAGSAWAIQATGISTQINGISCATTSTCVAVGDFGEAMRTTNGGTSWASVLVNGGNFVGAVSCASTSVCFAVGALGSILKSVDGGATWNPQNSGTTNHLLAISCPSTTVCAAVGVGVQLWTSDGTTWTISNSPTTITLLGVSCLGSTYCMAVGSGGTVLTSTNPSCCWSAGDVASSGTLVGVSCTGVCFITGVDGTVYIRPGLQSGTVPGHGSTGASGILYGISCPSASTCFAAGDYDTVVATTNAGTGWAQQTGTGTAEYAISCPSTSVCVAVGFQGAIAGTTNGGTNWSNQTSGTTQNLLSVSCPSVSVCFAVGNAGTVIATTNGGTNWTAQTSNTTQVLQGISCASTTACFAVTNGANFIKTTDGATWSTPAAVSTAMGLTGISCPSATTCFAIDSDNPTTNLIFSTTNGGTSWGLSFNLASDQLAGLNAAFAAIACPSVTNCYAVGGSGLIATTNDGGQNWRTDNAGTSAPLSGISCPAAGTCYASVYQFNGSTILHTGDYGGTWDFQYGGGTNQYAYTAISCGSATMCIALGYSVASGTTTGGAAWTKSLPAGTTNRVRSLSCPSATDCYATAGNTLLATHNGGGTWAATNLGTTDQFASISCPATNTCYAVGWPGAIYSTTDGGTTWNPVSNSLYGSDNTLLGVSCANTMNCSAVGTLGNILTMTNGVTWGAESSTTTQHLFGVSCPNNSSCIAVGDGGTIVTKVGTFWHASTSGTTTNLRGVSCQSSFCFAVGWSGTVLATTNFGSSWSAQSSGVTKSLLGVNCLRTDYCLAVGSGGTAIMTVDGKQWIGVATPVYYSLFAVAVPDANHAWIGGLGGTILANGTLSPSCASTSTSVSSRAVSSAKQYNLPNSDGSTWQELDAVALRFYCNPTVNQSVLLTANADLWTANAGFNQDIGIFVSDNGAADTLVAWKESGGLAGTFSPNAAYVQALFNMLAGHSYVFKLKWKANQPAGGATIFAGAGGLIYSPTSLIAETFPTGTSPNFAVSNKQYNLPSSDGVTWQTIDATLLSTTLTPSANATAVLGANVDLWTANSGYNQDIAIFVSVDGGTDTLVAWKESGGLAGTFSPNAAFVKATYAMLVGHSYAFKLKWKANQNAAGATIYAAAGGGALGYSPTSLFAQTIASGPNPYTAVSNTQYQLPNSDGLNWMLMDPALNVTVAPASDANSILGANVDLWTANAGFNQDIGIFVSDNGGVDTLVAWKESGGLAGTFSPNAAFAQAGFAMKSGHTYLFKLKWKANQNAPGATIFAGAGNSATGFSPTRLTVELTS